VPAEVGLVGGSVLGGGVACRAGFIVRTDEDVDTVVQLLVFELQRGVLRGELRNSENMSRKERVGEWEGLGRARRIAGAVGGGDIATGAPSGPRRRQPRERPRAPQGR
jgi:hypothetical protein